MAVSGRPSRAGRGAARIGALCGRPRVRRQAAAWVFLLAGILTASPAAAATGSVALWVDASGTPLPSVVAALPAMRGVVDALIVDTLRGGRVVVGPAPGVLTGAPGTPVKPEAFRDLIQSAHQQGIRVFGHVDALDWGSAGAAAGGGALAARPDLKEMPPETAGSKADHGYASPWHPDVRRALAEHVTGLGDAFPELDGLVLTAHLHPRDVLGHSAAARQAYIQAKQIDPIDLTLVSTGQREMDLLVREWMLWRRAEVGDLVGALGAAFKRSVQAARKAGGLGALPAPTVAARAYAGYYSLDTIPQGALAEDWLSWVDRGLVDEILLVASDVQPWSRSVTGGLLPLVKGWVGKTRNPVPVRACLPVRYAATAEDLRREYETATTQGAPRVALRALDARELALSLQFIAAMRGHGER